MSVNVMASTRDIAWLSGLLEGEGSFILTGENRILISIEMTDEDVIQKVARLWDSKIFNHQRGQNKRMYITKIHTKLAIQWMMTLFPLMGRRRQEKIVHLLNIWRLSQTMGMGSGSFNKSKSVCVNGHPYNEENTYFDPSNGSRSCKICKRERRIKPMPYTNPFLQMIMRSKK